MHLITSASALYESTFMAGKDISATMTEDDICCNTQIALQKKTYHNATGNEVGIFAVHLIACK